MYAIRSYYVSFKNINNVDILELNEDFSNSEYQTIIYYYNGYIYELLKQKVQDFDLGNGVKIVKADELKIKPIDNNLIQIEIINNGFQQSTYVSLKSAILPEVTSDE